MHTQSQRSEDENIFESRADEPQVDARSDHEIGGIGPQDPLRQDRSDLGQASGGEDEHLPRRRVEAGVVEDHAPVRKTDRRTDEGLATFVSCPDLFLGNIMPALFGAALDARHGQIGIIDTHMHHDNKVSTRSGTLNDLELRGMREDGFGGKAPSCVHQIDPPRFGNPGGFVGSFHRRVPKLVALDEIGIDERTREAWGDAGLVEGRFASAIRPGKQDKAWPQDVVSALA